jgi:hypothetical protein
MCIMEVRAGQRASTIAQACAHNTATVLGDIDMFHELLERRGEDEMVRALDQAKGNLNRAFADLLEMFGEFASREEASHGVHFTADDEHGHDGSHERSFIEVAHHDAVLARPSETR